MNIQFMSLGSGSSGNCYFLGTKAHGLFIDAGIGIRNIQKIAKNYGIKMEHIRGVLVTHDHADHIKAVGHLAEKFNIPVYATREIHEGLDRNYGMTKKLSDVHKRFIRKKETLQIADFTITCFDVPHDATDNCGFYIETGGKVFSFITDIGHITEEVAQYIQRTNYLIIEANYDEAMLQTGPYPIRLKERIASPNGHMCNREMANYLACHFPPGLQHVWLCHLSKDNNRPDIALQTVVNAFQKQGITVGQDVKVTPLQRTLPSDMFSFETEEQDGTRLMMAFP